MLYMNDTHREQSRHSILLVDDDENVLKAMKRLFFNIPHLELITADSADKAKAILETTGIHILVTDQQMPEVLGTELLAYARKHHPATQRLLLTGYADTKLLSDSVNGGNIHRFYAKPVDPGTFISEMEEQLRCYERKVANRRALHSLRVRAQSHSVAPARTARDGTPGDACLPADEVQTALRALSGIATAMNAEKDEDSLFRLTLETCIRVSEADSGTIYAVESTEHGGLGLRVRSTGNRSGNIQQACDEPSQDSLMLTCLAGIDLNSLSVPDLYSRATGIPHAFDRTCASESDCRTKSMAVIPIMNVLKQPVGFIQLFDRKSQSSRVSGSSADQIVAFTAEQITFLEAIAGQAAISLENVRRIKAFDERFKDFMIASVKALESRDPSMEGHSLRVATLCVNIAHAMNIDEDAVQALEYAALLHDLGRAFVDPLHSHTTGRLQPADRDRLDLTLDYLYRYQELCYSRHELRLHDRSFTKGTDYSFLIKELHKERDEVLIGIKTLKTAVHGLCEPVQDAQESEKELSLLLDRLHTLRCVDIDGNPFSPLRGADFDKLSSSPGALSSDEQSMLEERNERTYRIVNSLNWSEPMRTVPAICLLYNERLDGTGFPNGRLAEGIPVSARILAAADFYDTARSDGRSLYGQNAGKRALGMLKAESDAGRMDASVVTILCSVISRDSLTPIPVYASMVQ